MKKFIYSIIFLLLIGLTATAVAGQKVPDSLKGLKTAKFVVDLNQGNADTLKLRLDLLMETINNIEEKGVKTDVVVAVRGQASGFMTVGDKYISPDEQVQKQSILSDVAALKKRGVKFEQCAIALRLLKINANDVNPMLTVVKNGYVSLIGYQNVGYAILPME